MRKALSVLLILCSTAQAEDPKPPPLQLCTLDGKPNEVYYCLETKLDDEVYVAVFAKDGLSAIRVAEIKKNGKQDVAFPWMGCSFFNRCVISKKGDN
jgi:hypothetical protein